MKIKPHKARGRFYNHPQDSLTRHIKSVLGTLIHIIKKKCKPRHTKKPFFNPDFKMHDWVEYRQPLPASHKPTITWLGHATFLIQIGGINILTDPLFFNISGFLRRIIPTPVSLDQLPPIDVIILSHNHQDHMDTKSLEILKRFDPLILVPLGDKKWFDRRNFKRVIENDWWAIESVTKNNEQVNFHFLPASHWTGRGPFDINKSLWGSWLIEHDGFKIYFAGDSAYAAHYQLIAQEHPAIQVALMPIAPNEPDAFMRGSHLSTQEAIQAFHELQAKHFIPMHWGTFKFGIDSFHDPITQLTTHWDAAGYNPQERILHIVKCGQAKKFSS